ncbi:MAG: hypothetical protein HOQ24_12480 [Mycobacteriaceae bacterium]|nr:hypothetical protein [Mycobacteriaceae bacterium]
MGITYNYSGVETSSLNFNAIATGIEKNNGDIKAFADQLLVDFKGAAAEVGFGPKAQEVIKALAAYQTEVTKLKNKIKEVAGEGGLMNVTDKNQGNKFLAINV